MGKRDTTLDWMRATGSARARRDADLFFADLMGHAPRGQEATDEAWAPGYTVCDFIDVHISVAAQYALFNLYSRGGAPGEKALLILAAIRTTGQLEGVRKQDEGAPAQLAQRSGTNWWTMLGNDGARVFTRERPPMMVFSRRLADGPASALADAILRAWDDARIVVDPTKIPPPSGRPCERPPAPPVVTPPVNPQDRPTPPDPGDPGNGPGGGDPGRGPGGGGPGPGSGPCSTACQALASMRRSAEGICRLAGESDPRCIAARARVARDAALVRASCPECFSEPPPPPIPNA